MKSKVIATNLLLKVSGTNQAVDIIRNESGNLEIIFLDKNFEKKFPNGTTSEMRNDELKISKYE